MNIATTAEVAEKLECSAWHVLRLADQYERETVGVCRREKFGGMWVWSREDIAGFYDWYKGVDGGYRC